MYGFNLVNTTALSGVTTIAATLYVGSTAISTAGQITNSTAPFNITGTADDGYLDIVVTCSATMSCNVGLGTATSGIETSPGFVLVEEALQGSTTHNWIYFPVAYSSTLVKAGISTPISDDATGFNTETKTVSGSTTYNGMTVYGTYLSYDPSSSLTATLSYPDSFSYANVYVLGPSGLVSSTGTAGSVTTQQVIPIITNVVKLDSEVTTSDESNNDLILVGGPCINTLVAQLATGGKFPYTCANWPGRNFGRIQLVSDAFATGKTALVVAGTRADDTRLASQIVQNAFPLATDSQKTGTSVEVTGSVTAPVYS
jgi:hypothetical protein